MTLSPRLRIALAFALLVITAALVAIRTDEILSRQLDDVDISIEELGWRER